MTRRRMIGMAIVSFLLCGGAGRGPDALGQDAELLKVGCVIAPSRLSRGQSGKAVIRFAAAVQLIQFLVASTQITHSKDYLDLIQVAG